MFKVKELFFSLQGEGHYVGTPAVFCRFTGCNKWSGQEETKTSSSCPFCDTDFVGGKSYTEAELVESIISLWPDGGRPRVIFTGGEPALQLTGQLIGRLKDRHFDVAVETNGSVALPLAPKNGSYWVTVSPKSTDIVVDHGHEIKVLWPNPATPPEHFARMDFRYFYLQPIHDAHYARNVAGAVEYILAHPQWALSLQTHKITGVR